MKDCTPDRLMYAELEAERAEEQAEAEAQAKPARVCCYCGIDLDEEGVTENEYLSGEGEVCGEDCLLNVTERQIARHILRNDCLERRIGYLQRSVWMLEEVVEENVRVSRAGVGQHKRHPAATEYALHLRNSCMAQAEGNMIGCAMLVLEWHAQQCEQYHV